MKYKFKSKMFSVLMAIFLIIAAVPITASAAPAKDIPEDMLNNAYLDALAYTGYNVTQQKNDGTIFVKYSNNAPASVRSGIGYGTACSGLETTAGKPDIAKFKSSGLCCASYVSYVYFNYLPNVVHIDTSQFPCPSNPRSAAAYNEAVNTWVNSKKARRISFSQSSNGSNFSPSEGIPIGSLIVFNNISTGAVAHVAIYMGYYNGQHFVSHVGSDNGPELCTIVGMSKGGSPEKVAQIVTPEIIAQYGKIEVTKTDTNGKDLSGAQFTAISKASGTEYKIGPTDANGYAVSVERIPYGTYAVRETVFPYNYVSYGQTEWTVTLNSSNNGIVRINAVNAQKMGTVEVTKFAEDGVKEGFIFRLKGTSVFGNAVNLTVTTNSSGIAVFKNVPIGNNYTLSEESTPIRYVIPTVQTVSVRYGEISKAAFNNEIKKFRVTVKKTDRETGTEQGNATLKGAVYGLFKDSQQIDIYTTDEKGTFITKYYACSDGWTIKEISPSEGYLLDDTVYPVGSESKKYTVQYNEISLSVKEQVKKGSVSIIKHSDDGSTQIETPEVGAEFDVFLKSSGSFEQAKNTERDHIVCNEDGYAVTKQMPFGIYTVHQTKGNYGSERIKDFDVAVSENSKTYSHIINDAVLKAAVKIIKKDSETGKTIPVSGIGFKVRNSSGEFITQNIFYPTPMDIDVFYTDATGSLILPEKLPFGDYEIIEQSAAPGYVLDKTPVAFTVDGTAETVIAEKRNVPQKGVIHIEKTGKVFSSVKEVNGLFVPAYCEKGLAGAKLEIRAAEDIYTSDGTLRYAKDTLADIVITDSDGKAESIPLYLGNYIVTEIKAPFGMVLLKKSQTVELTYAGENISFTTKFVSIRNERQKAGISLLKELEQNEVFKLGGSKQYKNVVFGLYAAEKIIAADGTCIPADGLIEAAQCNENGEIMFTADIPFGKYYIKEVSTDSHYVLDNKEYPIDFNYSEQETATVMISVNDGLPIKNMLLRGSVATTKINRDYPDNKLTGAVFEIYADVNGNGIFDEGTDVLVGQMTETETGRYSLENLTCGEYFLYEKTAPIGYIRDREYYSFKISEDNIVVVSNNAGNGFYNKPIHSNTPTSPKTGDNTRPISFVLALFGSLGTLTVLMIIKKKKFERN